MVIDAVGPWNDEFFPQLHKKIVAVRKHFDANNYGVLLNLHGEAVTSPSNLRSHIAFIRQGGARAAAVNISDCTTKAISQELISQAYGSINLKYAFFNNNSDATIWLQTYLD